MSGPAIIGLRVLLVIVGVCALLAQVRVVPALAGRLARDSGLLDIQVPYAIAAIAVIACVQLALIATWVLLSMLRQGSLLSEHAVRWVDVIIGAGVVATLIVAGLGLHSFLVVHPVLGSPGLVAVALASCVVGAAFVLMVVVMRAMLKVATHLQEQLTMSSIASGVPGR